jgi:PAS domain S-box-containing protein
VFANAQSETLFGYSRAELVGQPLEMLVPERLRARHLAHRDAYAAAPRTWPMGADRELFGLRKDGTEFPAEITLSCMQTGARRFFSSAIRDVTSRKAAQCVLRGARDEAERANGAKSECPAAASHDIRQPLDGVLGRALPSCSKAAGALASQDLAQHSMANLVSSLLDMSNLDAGVIEPAVSDCEVQATRASAARTGEQDESPLVLVVDDEPAVADATVLLLETFGFRAVTATSVAHTTEQLRALDRTPDLVLCDLRLAGGESGIDAIRVIRDATDPALPVIVMSGDTSTEARTALREVGHCERLDKPVDADELLELMNRVLEERARRPTQ